MFYLILKGHRPLQIVPDGFVTALGLVVLSAISARRRSRGSSNGLRPANANCVFNVLLHPGTQSRLIVGRHIVLPLSP
jgi:hypothetical protein